MSIAEAGLDADSPQRSETDAISQNKLNEAFGRWTCPRCGNREFYVDRIHGSIWDAEVGSIREITQEEPVIWCSECTERWNDTAKTAASKAVVVDYIKDAAREAIAAFTVAFPYAPGHEGRHTEFFTTMELLRDLLNDDREQPKLTPMFPCPACGSESNVIRDNNDQETEYRRCWNWECGQSFHHQKRF